MIKKTTGLHPAAFLMSGLLLLSMAGCGSAPARQPVAIELANKADQEAHRALRDGDLMRAYELFRQSMLFQQSVDNHPASALAAINLSFVSHKLGKDAIALDLLDSIPTDSTVQISSELRAAAAFRKGIIYADTGKIDKAEAALQLALQICNKQCSFGAGMSNLGARLALNKGDYTTALANAKSVISNGAENDELANAQRIAALAESALGQHEAALTHYQAALELDKELALSSRIAEDLRGIASVLHKLGRIAEAEIFARRAESVTTSARLLPGKSTKNILP